MNKSVTVKNTDRDITKTKPLLVPSQNTVNLETLHQETRADKTLVALTYPMQSYRPAAA